MNFLLLIAALMAMVTGSGDTIITEKVEYEYDGVTLAGYVAYDASIESPQPGVLVVHEWWGLNDYAKMRARQLAELGYVAFAVDMYGDGAVATTSEDAGTLAGKVRGDYTLMRGRINAGLEILEARDDVDPDRIAAIGYCFGGSTVLELARSGADVAGVVSFHGGLKTADPASKGDIKAKVLVLHGADDPNVTMDQVITFQDEMRAAGADWQMVFYSDAVHSFTNPAAGDDPSKGAAYNANADRRSWAAMLAFFEEIFAE